MWQKWKKKVIVDITKHYDRIPWIIASTSGDGTFCYVESFVSRTVYSFYIVHKSRCIVILHDAFIHSFIPHTYDASYVCSIAISGQKSIIFTTLYLFFPYAFYIWENDCCIYFLYLLAKRKEVLDYVSTYAWMWCVPYLLYIHTYAGIREMHFIIIWVKYLFYEVAAYLHFNSAYAAAAGVRRECDDDKMMRDIWTHYRMGMACSIIHMYVLCMGSSSVRRAKMFLDCVARVSGCIRKAAAHRKMCAVQNKNKHFFLVYV